MLVVATVTAQAHAAYREHIGLQLYSLRENTKAKGMLSSLDLVKGWGITEVEQFHAALVARGLKAISVHVQYEDLTKDVAAVIKDAQTMGAQYAICPWVPHTGAFDAALRQKTVDDFNRWGAAFRAAGIKFGYHPHGYEFTPGAKPGETQLDELIRGTKPKNVCFELDVFWIVHGGGDPVKLLEKYSGRWVALHLKDMKKGTPVGFTTGHAKDTDNVAVGTGLVDWQAVISTAEKVGVHYYFIEDETPAPLDCIPASLAFLRALKP